MPDISQILNGKLDVYEFLEVDPLATDAEIKRAYRKKALVYHPDKNNGHEASETFHLLSQVYEILTSSTLKHEYDRIRQLKLSKKVEIAKLDAETRRFREQLERAEQEYAFSSTSTFDRTNAEFAERDAIARKADRLQEDAMRKRRKREQQRFDSSTLASAAAAADTKGYRSYKDIENSQPLGLGFGIFESVESGPEPLRTQTVVKWKSKPELKGMIDSEVIRQIMSIFGAVKSVVLETEHVLRYDSAFVEYELSESALKATGHDYKQSARLWDGTSVRKLSSLLRECSFSPATDQPGLDSGEIHYITKQIREREPGLQKSLLALLEGRSKTDMMLKEVLKGDIERAKQEKQG